jgi:hypothetical protein
MFQKKLKILLFKLKIEFRENFIKKKNIFILKKNLA